MSSPFNMFFFLYNQFILPERKVEIHSDFERSLVIAQPGMAKRGASGSYLGLT